MKFFYQKMCIKNVTLITISYLTIDFFNSQVKNTYLAYGHKCEYIHVYIKKSVRDYFCVWTNGHVNIFIRTSNKKEQKRFLKRWSRITHYKGALFSSFNSHKHWSHFLLFLFSALNASYQIDMRSSLWSRK